MDTPTNTLTTMDAPAEPQGPAALYTPPPVMRSGGLLSRGNILLAGLFVAALVGLYIIHATAGPDSAAASTKEIDKKLDGFLKQLQDLKKQGGKKATAIDTSRFEARHRQIAVTDLHLNPFRYKPIEAAGALPTITPTSQSASTAVPPQDTAAAAKEAADAIAKVKSLKLQSVMMGQEPAALIDGTMIGLGQKILGWTVVDIQSQTVRLQWRDKTYTLYLD